MSVLMADALQAGAWTYTERGIHQPTQHLLEDTRACGIVQAGRATYALRLHAGRARLGVETKGQIH